MNVIGFECYECYFVFYDCHVILNDDPYVCNGSKFYSCTLTNARYRNLI